MEVATNGTPKTAPLPAVASAPITGAKDDSQLLKKLCLIMGELGNLPKNGYNEFHKYHYVREVDVVNKVRELLAKHGVMIIPRIASEERTAIQGRNGAKFLTRLLINYQVKCVETGQSIEIPWMGYGEDSGEKGFYKATTGGHKTFLMKLFNVSGDDSQTDPENERTSPPRDSGPSRPAAHTSAHAESGRPAAPHRGNPRLADQHLNQLFATGKAKGWNQPQVREQMVRMFNTKDPRALTLAQCEELTKFIAANPRRPAQ